MGRRRTISDEKIADYLTLLEMGWTYQQVGEKYGRHGSAIRQALEVRQVGGLKKYGKNLEIEVIALYKSGMSTGQVSEKVGIAQATVLSYLKKYKIPKHKCILAEEYWQCYETGMSIAEIAEAYGRNASGVYLLLKRYGYKPRSQSLHHNLEPIAKAQIELLDKLIAEQNPCGLI